MSNFDNIIQEINTNLPDNNTQAITAAKLRTTLIDLTNAIDTVQDDFQQDISDELFDLVVDNLTSTSTTNALSANQGRILNETIDDVSHSVSDLSNRVTNLVVDNLTTEDVTKALSANQGRVLDEKITNIPEELVNPQTKTIDLTTTTPAVETTEYYIGTSSLTWFTDANTISAIIPVNEAQTWYFATTRLTSVQYGFFTSHPTPVNQQSAGLLGDRLYYMNTTTYPETSRTFTPPAGAKYMYVKMRQGTTGGQAVWYSPTTVEVSIARVITANDIVNNLESTDSTKVLAASVGPQIGEIKDAIAKEPIVALQQCDQISFVITPSSLNWNAASNAISAIVPVSPGEKVYVKAQIGKTTHIGFWASYPTPVAGESANLIDGIKYTGTSGHPVLDETYTVPETAHYMYVKIHEGTADYTPEVVKFITTNKTLNIDSYYDNEVYADTYIEEDIMAYSSTQATGQYRVKLYKIDPTVDYRIILYSIAKSSDTRNQVQFYDSSMTLISGTHAASTSEYWVGIDDPLTIPAGTTYILVQGYMQARLSSQFTNRGCFALMKPIRNDGSMPRNNNIYCVSKIKAPVMPYNYSASETTFPQTDIWSAWSFMLPYGAQQVTGKKQFPLVSFFHGSSGFVTSEYMGYNTSVTPNGIVGKLRKKGCCVFDINGWGVSQDSGAYSRHWGNPIAVATAKKAYEILTSRFNCRKGMMISGISMGGAISKSYCMIHPEDVIGAALEAPSELGCTIRGGMTWNGEVATAWGGYESAEAMEADVNRDRFIGYSPLIKPLIIDSESNMKFMPNVMDYKSVYNPSASGYNNSNNMLNPTNIDTFYNPFPVEIKIWHGDADTNVSLKYSQCFVNTVRKANCNATLRLCPGCTHDLNEYPWVINEVVNYIVDRISI